MSVKLGQTKLRIIRWINVDLIDVDTLVLKFIKPSGKSDHWDAVKYTEDTKQGGYYDVIKIDPPDKPVIDEIGDWKIWLDATWSDERHAEGDVKIMTVVKPGSK